MGLKIQILAGMAVFFFWNSSGLLAQSRDSAGRFGFSDAAGLPSRSSAIGPAFLAVADDVSALFSNPAGLSFLRESEVSFHSQFYLLDSFKETLVLGLPLEPGGLAISGSYLNYGAFQGRDEMGFPAASYDADQLELSLGWGLELFPGISVGLSLQGLQENLAGNPYTFWDSGFGAVWNPVKDFKLGASLINYGVQTSSFSSAPLFNFDGSYQWRLDKDLGLLTAAGFSTEPDALSRVQAGLELSYQAHYFLRAGYQADLGDGGMNGFSGMTAGAGLSGSNFFLDYAFRFYGDLGNSHQFSLGYRFETRGPNVKKLELPPKPLAASVTPSVTPNATPDFTAAPSLLPPPEAAPKPSVKEEGQENLTVRFSLPPNLVAKGDALEAEGRHQEAIQIYRKALRQNPGDSVAWWSLGDVYAKLGQKEEAVRCFGKVLQLRPDNRPLEEWLEKYKQLTP